MAATALLVVATTGKPASTTTWALAASQAFGRTSNPSWCRRRSSSALALRSVVVGSVVVVISSSSNHRWVSPEPDGAGGVG